MKLTSQQEYGLRCLLRLARETAPNGDPLGGNTLAVNKIADEEGLSTEYAGKLMGVLSRGQLVASIRGRNGGYRLARPAREITLSEALAVLGGKLYDGETCSRFRGEKHQCIHTSGCTIRSVWSGLQFIIDRVLSQTALQDLIDHSEESMSGWVDRLVQALVEQHEPGPDPCEQLLAQVSGNEAPVAGSK